MARAQTHTHSLTHTSRERAGRATHALLFVVCNLYDIVVFDLYDVVSGRSKCLWLHLLQLLLQGRNGCCNSSGCAWAMIHVSADGLPFSSA